MKLISKCLATLTTHKSCRLQVTKKKKKKQKNKKKKKMYAEAYDIINLDIEKPTSVGKVYKELHH